MTVSETFKRGIILHPKVTSQSFIRSFLLVNEK